MMNFQLARMGYLDFWSLHESLETPNIGTPPPMPLTPLQPPNPQEVQQEMLASLQAVANGLPPPPMKYTMGPNGEILEIRVPQTVTERLQAQQLLGIGMTENPAGRKASGQAAPQQEQSTDENGAPRQTIRESKK